MGCPLGDAWVGRGYRCGTKGVVAGCMGGCVACGRCLEVENELLKLEARRGTIFQQGKPSSFAFPIFGFGKLCSLCRTIRAEAEDELLSAGMPEDEVQPEA